MTMSMKRRFLAGFNRFTFLRNLVYTAKHGPAKGFRRQGGYGWLPSCFPGVHEGAVETAFLAGLDWLDQTVYDIGCDQGLYTLFFAFHVGPGGRVIAFEPNPRSRERIRRNVEINGFSNVRVMPVGIGRERCTLEFTVPPGEPSRGSADPAIAWDLKAEGGARIHKFLVNSLDDEIARTHLPVPQFIKIDIEGMEYQALQGMQETLARNRPALFIELHDCMEAMERRKHLDGVLGLLRDLDYSLYRIESRERVDGRGADSVEGGHFYCEPATGRQR